MQTLIRFWQWHRTELPDATSAGLMAIRNLSPLADHALMLATIEIAKRARPTCQPDWGHLLPALEALSTAFCAALDAMHQAVPEAPPE